MIDQGFLDEIFVSYQGEGVLCGVRQVFVRFSLCNLKCAYCDTVAAGELKEKFNAFNGKKVKNPVTVAGVVKLLKSYRGKVHSVSLTGGEPLLQEAFVVRLAKALKKAGFRIYLETNGTLVNALKNILPYTDQVAMDIKLPSTAKVKGLWKTHAEFLKIAGKKAFVKIVVGEDFKISELKKALRLTKNKITVLQPCFGCNSAQLAERIEKTGIYNTVSEIRFVPQIHRLMGIK